jgi:hypothetical protein
VPVTTMPARVLRDHPPRSRLPHRWGALPPGASGSRTC